MANRGRSRKPVGPRGLCAYFVEIEERDGQTSVPEEFAFLVRKCIEDKIFSENQDEIAVCRSDATSHIGFAAADWHGLRKGLRVLNETRSDENGGPQNPISSLIDVADALQAQAQEDTYEGKKILFFANLGSYILSKEEAEELAEKLLGNDIFINIILPNKEDMTETQLHNSKLLGSVFEQDKYDDITAVKSLKLAKRQILNTNSKKATRPAPWNVLMEITPSVIINVGGYVCTRKNKIGEMTRVLLKQSESGSSETTNSSSEVNQPTEPESGDNVGSKKTVVVEVAKSVLEKETVWSGADKTPVEEEDVGKGYAFGDKIIPYNELENKDSYQSGDKCLKVLVFCPLENINPAFLTGDGTTLFFPKKDDIKSELMLRALIKAMASANRIAVVRKVYRKNTKVVLGALVPDVERQCLVFSELCFADDVSIPHLPLLIKPEEIAEDANEGVSDKEALIDDLITAKTLDTFSPFDGPSDPAVSALREKVASKILEGELKDSKATANGDDNLEVFFENLIVDEGKLAQIREKFPLKVNKVESERPAGTNVFRKRKANEEKSEVDKKPKVEVSSVAEGAAMEEEEENEDEINDLLDEL